VARGECAPISNEPAEFGAKLSVSLSGGGLAHVDHLRWDAFHEGLDLPAQVEAYFVAFAVAVFE
jgi:hypothetical protein